MPSKPHILLMGQTPPPWHGQAVATQILFDHDWPDFHIHRLRMEFSHEMLEVGRFRWWKILHLMQLILKGGMILWKNPGCILFYPPASANWVPFFRDVVILLLLRPLAGKTVFIYHASGLASFCHKGWLRSFLAKLAYANADISLEVAEEKYPPHRAFSAKSWRWCPCAIEVPEIDCTRTGASKKTTVLFVGSLQEGKGILEILRTAKILKDRNREKDFHFRIIGKWYSKEFESEALGLYDELGLSGLVSFDGQLTGDDKWRAYAEADVFFFPTHYASEASPIVLMEALGMGLRIISTEWAGIPALMKGCATAELHPIHAPEQYADALERAFIDRERAAQIHATSKEFYRNNFQPSQFIDRVARAFADCGGEPADSQTCASKQIKVMVYLADQHLKLGRSLGIQRMTQVVLDALAFRDDIRLGTVVSKSSVQAPSGASPIVKVPWSTRSHLLRAFTDNLHPLFTLPRRRPDLWYFPKGFMPRFHGGLQPTVVTIHDTIIQYYQDHYPQWRLDLEYNYWAGMLRNTLLHATAIMTVSRHAKGQIEEFIRRHKLPEREIHVTYESCLYEDIPQPVDPAKADHVVHLGSREPHKRTAWLIRLWAEWSALDDKLPYLHVIGRIPEEVAELERGCPKIVCLPYLEDKALIAEFTSAMALILPSEIEGFGLPAIEAYYLGTPVCFVRGTSVEEVLEGTTSQGGFDLNDPESLRAALVEVLTLTPEQIHHHGLHLRNQYHSTKIVEQMVNIFQTVAPVAARL
jgi:glycosyltransferase involved in cell wall biosynthesis